MHRLRDALQQIMFLIYETSRLVNGRWWRLWSVPFNTNFWVVASYRVSRCGYLLLGPLWRVIHVLTSPVRFLLRPWSGGCEISYRASIGRGLKILHPSLGIVIPAYAVIGDHFTLTGGNCIGTNGDPRKTGDVWIGNGVLLGANAVVVAPIRIGDRAVISACSLAIRDVGPGEVVGGVPARLLTHRT